MDLTTILAISGSPGLYKLVGQMKNGIIVESLRDGKRVPAYAADKISALGDISIYTYDSDIPLKDIMKAIAEKANNEPVSLKGDLRGWFKEILPDFDEERVYTSDIKKVARWYNDLQAADMLDFSEETAAEADVEVEEVAAEKNPAVEDAEIVEDVADSDSSDEEEAEKAE